MSAAILGAAPSDEVGFVLPVGAVGGLAGTAYVAWRRVGSPEADTWLPVALGGLVFAVAAAIFVLVEAVR